MDVDGKRSLRSPDRTTATATKTSQPDPGSSMGTKPQAASHVSPLMARHALPQTESQSWRWAQTAIDELEPQTPLTALASNIRRMDGMFCHTQTHTHTHALSHTIGAPTRTFFQAQHISCDDSLHIFVLCTHIRVIIAQPRSPQLATAHTTVGHAQQGLR